MNYEELGIIVEAAIEQYTNNKIDEDVLIEYIQEKIIELKNK